MVFTKEIARFVLNTEFLSVFHIEFLDLWWRWLNHCGANRQPFPFHYSFLLLILIWIPPALNIMTKGHTRLLGICSLIPPFHLMMKLVKK